MIAIQLNQDSRQNYKNGEQSGNKLKRSLGDENH